MLKELFRKKKTIVYDHDTGLKKTLGAFDLTLLGIGAIIGTGIFVLTGVAAATQAGPAVVLSFIIAGIACTFAALAYAELASSVGGCGSAYGYSYAAFGEFIAWIIGWDLVLEYGVAVAAVANGWSGYFNNALTAIGYGLPEYLTKGPAMQMVANCQGLGENSGYFANFSHCVTTFSPQLHAYFFAPNALSLGLIFGTLNINFSAGLLNIAAVFIILAIMIMLIIGIKESARLNAGMVFIKLLTIAVFIAVAVFHVNPDNWTPFMPFGWFAVEENGHTIGVLAAASLVFFAYVGFDAVSTAVEESRNPQRDVPIGIMGSLIFCTVIYIVVSGLLTGLIPYPELNVSSPVAFALHKVGVDWASALVATGVITGLTTVMLVLYYALTRVILGVARDGLIPPYFAKVSDKTQTPVRNTVICGVIMAIMAGFMPLGALAELVNIGTLAAFVLVCLGVIALRIQQPDLPRPFKMPFGLLLPICGVLSCGALIAFLPWHTHLRFIGWLALGAMIYFAYGFRHSHLAKKE